MRKLNSLYKFSIGALMTVSAFALPSLANAQSHFIKTTGKTSMPIGHYEYCAVYKKDCRIKSKNVKPTQLTRARWEDIVRVNAYANKSIVPVTDLEYYNREEYWVYPEKYGDCEDYVLLKRKMLMEKGWPASNLLITVVQQPNGDGHAVLTVRTDRGDYTLDNLNDRVLPWNKTEYRYLKRQSSRHSGRWVGIDDPRRNVVGSIKN